MAAPRKNELVLVTLHGGCFVGGSVDWDAEQNAALRARGFRVLQLDFPREALASTLAWIRAAVEDLPRPRLVLGRSSGGFLAKVLVDDGTFDRGVYLAPVFSPLLRAELKPELGLKAAPFFAGQDVPSTRGPWRADRELLCLALSDDNAPDALFTLPQLECALRPGPRTHTGLLACTSRAFLDVVCAFLTGA